MESAGGEERIVFRGPSSSPEAWCRSGPGRRGFFGRDFVLDSLGRRPAVRTQVPRELEQPSTTRARLAQPSVAVGAKQPIVLGLPAAARARPVGLDAAEQGFLFQRPFVLFFQGQARAQDQIDDHARQVEEKHEQGGQDAQETVLRAGPDVAPGPEDQAQPQGDEEGAERGGEIEKNPSKSFSAKAGHSGRDYSMRVWAPSRAHLPTTGENAIPARAGIQAMCLARTGPPCLRGGPSDTSFPRKRESRRRAGIGLDPRFRRGEHILVRQSRAGGNPGLSCFALTPASPSGCEALFAGVTGWARFRARTSTGNLPPVA